MALMRCPAHGKPEGRTQEYVRTVEPVGYPGSAVLCGLTGCETVALICLTAAEAAAYDRGERVFKGPTGVMKVRAI